MTVLQLHHNLIFLEGCQNYILTNHANEKPKLFLKSFALDNKTRYSLYNWPAAKFHPDKDENNHMSCILLILLSNSNST